MRESSGAGPLPPGPPPALCSAGRSRDSNTRALTQAPFSHARARPHTRPHTASHTQSNSSLSHNLTASHAHRRAGTHIPKTRVRVVHTHTNTDMCTHTFQLHILHLHTPRSLTLTWEHLPDTGTGVLCPSLSVGFASAPKFARQSAGKICH